MEKQKINNQIYFDLGKKWYLAKDDPIALLRAESRHRNPWVENLIRAEGDTSRKKVLDIACGAGFLSNFLGRNNIEVTGVDISEDALKIAQEYAPEKKVTYRKGDAHSLDFENESFDTACIMDFLEHTENPLKVIQEASRVLKKGGQVFTYTFNRTWLAYYLVIKSLEWIIPNTPRNLHIYSLFIKPQELSLMMEKSGLKVIHFEGVRPVIFQKAMLGLIFKGKVSDGFKFTTTKSLSVGYLCYGKKI